MEIVLLGYMASGKSTIGKHISDKMNLNFIDLDAYIEKKENKSISDIFSSKGEIYFRKQEGIYLKEILSAKSNYVLALGGGTPCYGANLEHIKKSSAKSIYLKANIPFLVKRLENEKSKRPLIANLNNNDLIEYIGKHLFERAPFYEQATFKVVIDHKTIDEVVKEITTQLH